MTVGLSPPVLVMFPERVAEVVEYVALLIVIEAIVGEAVVVSVVVVDPVGTAVVLA